MLRNRLRERILAKRRVQADFDFDKQCRAMDKLADKLISRIQAVVDRYERMGGPDRYGKESKELAKAIADGLFEMDNIASELQRKI